MNIGKAMAVFLQIDSNKFSDEEKTEAIFLVMNMATHNSIKKDNMIAALKWLWHQQFEWTEVKKQTNFERIKAMSVEEMAHLLGRNADCENYCAFVDEIGACNGQGNVCTMGVKKWLESEVETE